MSVHRSSGSIPPRGSSQRHALPWSVRSGKMNNDEWGVEVLFSDVTDAQWTVLRDQGERYSRFHFRTCPPIHVSRSEKRFQFRLGHTFAKPKLVADSGRLSSAECGILRENLVACAEVLHKQMLGIWWIDRSLLWKIDGLFVFIPTFWFPAFSDRNMAFPVSSLPGLAPEHSEFPSKEPSQTRDIYAIASVCFLALSGKEYDFNNPIVPNSQRSELGGWSSVLEPALRKVPSRRLTSFQEWMQSKPVAATQAKQSPIRQPAPRPPQSPSPPVSRQNPTSQQQPYHAPQKIEEDEPEGRGFLATVGSCLFILFVAVAILVVLSVGGIFLLNSFDKEGVFHRSMEEKTGIRVPLIPRGEEQKKPEELVSAFPEGVTGTPSNETGNKNENQEQVSDSEVNTKEQDDTLPMPPEKPLPKTDDESPSVKVEEPPAITKPNPFRK